MEDLAGLGDLRGLCYAAPPTGVTWRSTYYAGTLRARIAMRVQTATPSGVWASTGPTQTGASGAFTYQPTSEWTYSFATRCQDVVGNWEWSGTPPANKVVSTAYSAPPPQVKRVTKYYALGGKRVAMRADSVVYYLHGDHLGSTSLVTCGSSGGCNGTAYQGVVSRQWYDPHGSLRGQMGTSPTDFTFTAQRHDSYIKLIQMGARWYDPLIGRWISADTVVPSPGNPQALNRYAYTLGNPLRYVDPTGHHECEDPNDCPVPANPFANPYGIRFTADRGQVWNASDVGSVLDAASAIAGRLAYTLQRANWLAYKTEGAAPKYFSPIAVFNEVLGGITFHRSADRGADSAFAFTDPSYKGKRIFVYSNANVFSSQNAAHEFGHSFAQRTGWDEADQTYQAYADLQAEWTANRNFPRRDPKNVDPRGYAGLRWTWQQSKGLAANEEFADMFLGWAYNRWEVDLLTGGLTDAGRVRSNWMTTNMAGWIAQASGR